MKGRSAMRMPDFMPVCLGNEKQQKTFRGEEKISFSGVTVTLKQEGTALNVLLAADAAPVRFLRLRWNMPMPEDAVYLGDAWERAYGDLQWRRLDASRVMPWYFLMSCGGRHSGFGVQVRPAAFASWWADSKGVTLLLDVRNGGEGVLLKGRELRVARIVRAESDGESAFAFANKFCGIMCSDPLLPSFPVYGGNNWYYAYGHSSAEEILNDCRYLLSLCKGLENPPFMVIDDGWQKNFDQGNNAGPWSEGNVRFPDMPDLIRKMKKIGVRPGIWFRPLWNTEAPAEWLHAADNPRALDPSHPEVRELVREDVRRFADWGIELIKHDFTTWDLFEQYGWQMRPLPQLSWTRPFYDRTLTSAEIVTELYRTIHEAAGNMLIIGCNTFGHLSAGHVHLSRVGDDTSGVNWERTRKNGINSLAFRMCQHGKFFAVDADCIGIKGALIPWRLNAQWGKLLAKSGTPFFASIEPGVLDSTQFAEVSACMEAASKQNFAAEPLDWMSTTCPEHWTVNGDACTFDWYAEDGSLGEFFV